MIIIHSKKENLIEYGIKNICDVYTIHVKISDVNIRAKEMINTISNMSWINKLDSVGQIAFKARAERTINRLVNEILSKVDNSVVSEFGEYMISDTAQCVLEKKCNHKKVPLAELLKEKVVGNPGFDFHTETTTELIAFGEAKYSKNNNPYVSASEQVVGFIHDKKDEADFIILERLVSRKSLDNAITKKKAYVVAFSINSVNPALIFKNALTSDAINKLFNYPELYLIGVEVDA